MSRRAFLSTAGTVVMVGASGMYIYDKLANQPTNPDPDVGDIFPFWSKLNLLPGQVHPESGYAPDVLEAQRGIVSLMERGDNVQVLPIDQLPRDLVSGDLFLIGGPISNSISRRIHGHVMDESTSKISIDPVKKNDLRYSFHYPYRQPDDPSYGRYVDGQYGPRWPKAILDQDRTSSLQRFLHAQVDASAGRIVKDYLLITVLPNGDERGNLGGTIIDIGDLHGQGDKMFATILRDRAARREIRRVIGGNKYFQLLYEVDVTHDDQSRKTTPSSARLVGHHVL